MTVVELIRSATARAETWDTARDLPARPDWHHPAKRAIDILLALLVLILTAPVILVAMLGIVLVSGGNPLYRHERVGLNGRPSAC